MVLLPTKIVFYALAISLVLLMIGYQGWKYRVMRRRAISSITTLGQEDFSDEDVEKGMFRRIGRERLLTDEKQHLSTIQRLPLVDVTAKEFDLLGEAGCIDIIGEYIGDTRTRPCVAVMI